MAKGASVSISDRPVRDATLESSLALIDTLGIERDGGSRAFYPTWLTRKYVMDPERYLAVALV